MPDHLAAVADGPGEDPADEAARVRIRDDVRSTLFVDAGAGSGKTTALVTRVVSLVASGAAEMRSLAAVTFTEKAAAELRDRVRRRLEHEAHLDPVGERGRRCRVALAQLDGAAVGTLHAFAQRLLREHPLEAGLPPHVEVLDEVSSSIAFDQRWRTFRDELLADHALERTILLLLATGVRHTALQVLAEAFDDNWDLVHERVPAVAPEPRDAFALLESALAPLDAVCAERADCTDPSDNLCTYLGHVDEWLRGIRAVDDELTLMDRLGAIPLTFRTSGGRAANWPDVKATRTRLREAGDGVFALRNRVGEDCARRIAVALRGFTLAAADARRRSGQLEFHDLLVLARSLLRDPVHGPDVRERLHGRYTHLLLDEFQDTDPMQIELAVRIAAADPRSHHAGAAPWPEVAVTPGQLFVVGDPKQSIYRFRRADIATFLRARARFGPEGGGVVELTSNFRTGGEVIAWVNHVFASLPAEDDDVEVPVPSQPTYLPLDAVRPSAPSGPAVSVLGRVAHARGTGAEALRAAEAADVAAVIGRALDEAWSVDDGAGGFRPPRLGDICILVPARTSLPYLEHELDRAGIPYRAESSALVFATRAVRDLLMVARAVDDPTDQLAVVSALRTPLFGCGDDDLFRFRVERHGHWGYLGRQPSTVPGDDPVASGLAYLAEAHGRRRWLAPSELLEQVARDRRAYELGVAEGRPRDVWRRIRFVVDQARGWSDVTGGSLRQYLQWVDRQAAGNGRIAEAVLPETDDDAVRIMTIHAAKGLEFPITIVSGLSTVPQARRAAAEVVFPPTGDPGYRFGAKVTTDEFELHRPIDEQMGLHERMRLLYVACTRAMDHLVVSLHRAERKRPPAAARRTNAELLVAGMGAELLGVLPDAVGAAVARPHRATAPPPSPPGAFAAWEHETATALAAAARPVAVAATALTADAVRDVDDHRLQLDLFAGEADDGLRKRPYDLDLPPWLKGRYGSAVGRAVHGVLQVVDLAAPDDLAAVVAAQCQAEAVPERAGDVGALARAALDSTVVRAAANAAHWRELYVCAAVGDRLLEGYVDLLFREPAVGDDRGGVVVVDYKTSASSDPAELDRRVRGYRRQGGAYALALGAVLGEPVQRVVFLFLTATGAVERTLPDLDGAVAEVRAALDAGDEVLIGG